MPLLEFHDVHKSFGAVRALRGVSFGVDAGEAHACVGENGAGKSTLLKILAGIVRPDRGEVRLDGEPLHFSQSARGAGARHRHGLPGAARVSEPDGAANIFAGRELTGRWGRLDEAGDARAHACAARRPAPADSARRADGARLGRARAARAGRARAGVRLPRPRPRRTDDVADRCGGRSPVPRSSRSSRRAA